MFLLSSQNGGRTVEGALRTVVLSGMGSLQCVTAVVSACVGIERKMAFKALSTLMLFRTKQVLEQETAFSPKFCMKDHPSFSWFQGYTRDDEYIAAQGPLPFTISDFWRMIWEHRIPIIVMLTLPKENGKVG